MKKYELESLIELFEEVETLNTIILESYSMINISTNSSPDTILSIDILDELYGTIRDALIQKRDKLLQKIENYKLIQIEED